MLKGWSGKEELGKYLSTFKQLNVNIYFVELLMQEQKYAKKLREILGFKKNLRDLSHVELEEECSIFLKGNQSMNMKDPRIFSIPCNLSSFYIENLVVDLGVSVNVMSYELFKILNL